MNTFTLPFQGLSARRAIAAAIAVLGFAAGAGAQAQAPQAQAATQAQQAQAATASAGRTRAEVIAELECARASGELEASVLRTYSLVVAPRPTGTPCGQSGTLAALDSAPDAASR
ncbi:hypothetical protein [Acidovorax sp. MR-S7]|uniref:hypothetical protein n=1 Tax=Acidovorax sp. MR-S7 TaxID=1268622 RepID=UPI00036DD866|nr:hypothetical protein [Acidovorax sp. MR-S7]GAD20795.1 hypothetical protein AVS7_00556 [Acidovorax sp. MR-S7]